MNMGPHIIGTPLRWVIQLFDPENPGQPIDADTLPTVALRINQAASGQTITTTKRAGTTGLYDCSASLSGLSEGDHLEALVEAVIAETAYSQAYEWTATEPMRGTDGANKQTPDNASIAAIKSKTDQLDFTGASNTLKSESTNMRGTDNALLNSSYTAPPSVEEIRTELEGEDTKLSQTHAKVEENLDAKVSSRAKPEDVNVEVTVDGGFGEEDAAKLNAIAQQVAEDIEAGVPLKAALRRILATTSGPSDRTGSTRRFYDPTGEKLRVTGTATDGNRTSTSYDDEDVNA